MLSGDLELSTDHSQVKNRWDQLETQLTSSTSAGGRGMELSELSVFNGRMLSLDDRYIGVLVLSVFSLTISIRKFFILMEFTFCCA